MYCPTLKFHNIFLFLQDKSNKNSESTSNLYSGSSSPLVEGEDNSRENLTDKEPLDIVVPPGWRLETDLENGCQCYVNVISGAKVSKNYSITILGLCKYLPRERISAGKIVLVKKRWGPKRKNFIKLFF